jgi:ABC-2 type transport system permease protein
MNDHSAPWIRMLAAQTRAQFLQLWRIPIFSILTIGFPVLFYLFFGLSAGNHPFEGTTAGAYIMVSLAAYGVLLATGGNFGTALAADRGERRDLLMRVTPLRPWIAITSRALVALGYALISMLLLFLVARLAGGVRLPLLSWFSLVVRLLLGALPFLFLGTFLGYALSPRSAAAVVNLGFVALAFLSGLFEPIKFLPNALQTIAHYLPTYWYAELGWGALGASHHPLTAAIGWLTLWGAVFLLLALRAYRKEESRRFV